MRPRPPLAYEVVKTREMLRKHLGGPDGHQPHPDGSPQDVHAGGAIKNPLPHPRLDAPLTLPGDTRVRARQPIDLLDEFPVVGRVERDDPPARYVDGAWNPEYDAHRERRTEAANALVDSLEPGRTYAFLPLRRYEEGFAGGLDLAAVNWVSTRRASRGRRYATLGMRAGPWQDSPHRFDPHSYWADRNGYVVLDLGVTGRDDQATRAARDKLVGVLRQVREAGQARGFQPLEREPGVVDQPGAGQMNIFGELETTQTLAGDEGATQLELTAEPAAPPRIAGTFTDLPTQRAQRIERLARLRDDRPALIREALDGLEVVGRNGETYRVEVDTDSRSFSGSIRDAKGARVGSFSRTLYSNHVYHSSWSNSRSIQGQGVGRQVLEAMEDAYIAMGLERIEVGANVDVGGYAWANLGFDFRTNAQRVEMTNPDVLRDALRNLRSGSRLNAYGEYDYDDGIPWDDPRFDAMLDDYEQRWNEGWRPSAVEVAWLGRALPRAKYNHLTVETEVYFGQAYLLGKGWSGQKKLPSYDPGDLADDTAEAAETASRRAAASPESTDPVALMDQMDDLQAAYQSNAAAASDFIHAMSDAEVEELAVLVGSNYETRVPMTKEDIQRMDRGLKNALVWQAIRFPEHGVVHPNRMPVDDRARVAGLISERLGAGEGSTQAVFDRVMSADQPTVNQMWKNTFTRVPTRPTARNLPDQRAIQQWTAVELREAITPFVAHIRSGAAGVHVPGYNPELSDAPTLRSLFEQMRAHARST